MNEISLCLVLGILAILIWASQREYQRALIKKLPKNRIAALPIYGAGYFIDMLTYPKDYFLKDKFLRGYIALLVNLISLSVFFILLLYLLIK